MKEVQIGDVIKVRFGNNRAVVKEAVVLCKKPGAKHILVESNDKKHMGSVIIDHEKDEEFYQTDGMCFIGGSGYPRDKAAKALGFKGIKI